VSETRPTKSLRAHPEAGRMPPMPVAERRSFEADVAENGIHVPLDITRDGVIVDGHLRHGVALSLDLPEVPVRVVEPADEVEYMYRVNLQRLHLTTGQRALMVIERDEFRAAQAAGAARKRANLRHSGVDVATLPHRGRSRALAADQAGVGERTIQKVITVREHGTPDQVEMLRRGITSPETAAREIGRIRRHAEIGEAGPLPAGSFNVIYADPPWPLGSSVEQHYPTMPTAEIAALRVPAAESAALFLWEVTTLRNDATAVIEQWGFTHKAEYVWVKPSIGTGNYVRNRHEKLLIATRGDFSIPLERFDSVVEAPRGRHSEKPKIFYELIEQMYPTATKLELFARGKTRTGWTAWGNEVKP